MVVGVLTIALRTKQAIKISSSRSSSKTVTGAGGDARRTR